MRNTLQSIFWIKDVESRLVELFLPGESWDYRLSTVMFIYFSVHRQSKAVLNKIRYNYMRN